MAVPSSNSHLRNTAGGAFSAQKQGGTILGNTTTGDVITKASSLIDNAADFGRAPIPVQVANGLIANQKVLSGGTVAYQAEGNYVIRTISGTISGVSSTNVLIPDQIQTLVARFISLNTLMVRKLSLSTERISILSLVLLLVALQTFLD